MSNSISSYVHLEETPTFKFDNTNDGWYTSIKIESDHPTFELMLFLKNRRDLINFKNAVLQAYEKEFRYV